MIFEKPYKKYEGKLLGDPFNSRKFFLLKLSSKKGQYQKRDKVFERFGFTTFEYSRRLSRVKEIWFNADEDSNWVRPIELTFDKRKEIVKSVFK